MFLFGKRGEGPEEMLSAETFQFNSLDSIYALDANKMQISRWAISAKDHSATRQEVIRLDKNLIRSLDFCATDSCFLIPDYLGEHRYWQVDYSGKPIRSIGKIPTEKDLASEIRPALAQAWRSFIDYNPHNGILAMVTQLGESIEIYNTKENTHTVLYGPNGEPRFKSIKGEGFPTGIMGFSDIVITDKYIYSVFQGIRFKDKLASYQRGRKAGRRRALYICIRPERKSHTKIHLRQTHIRNRYKRKNKDGHRHMCRKRRADHGI